VHIDSSGTCASGGASISQKGGDEGGQIVQDGFQTCNAEFDEDEQVQGTTSPKGAVVRVLESLVDLQEDLSGWQALHA
jgi:hypothetical protein